MTVLFWRLLEFFLCFPSPLTIRTLLPLTRDRQDLGPGRGIGYSVTHGALKAFDGNHKDVVIGYRATETPEYHQWVAMVLGASKTRVIVSQKCDGVLSLTAAVESGHAPAVVGEFTTAIAGDRVRYIPFVPKTSSMDVGLL